MDSRSLVRASSGADRWFEIKSQVHHKLVNSLTSEQLRDLNKDSVRLEVGAVVEKLILDEALPMTVGEREKLIAEILDEVFGLGPLEPLLKDPSISDIMVNGFDNVYIERAGRLVETNVRFKDQAHVRMIIERIVSAVGRRIDDSSPIVDARLMDGSRVNIVFPPLALDGPYISIRKFQRRKIDFARLVAYGSLTAQVARVLEIAGRSRLNIIISGGTGSGKTTMMNALSRMIDPAERVITIEDAAELQLQQPHVVRMETRPANLEGKGQVDQRDLVRNALRMRPERIIIGEVRGGEAFDMLQAMNTGHDGSMSTIHANNTRDALTRVENMVQMGNMGLPSRAIKTQIVGAVDIIVQVERHRDGGRRVTQVTDVVGLEGDVVIMNDIFQFEFTGETPEGRLSGSYKIGRGRPSFWERLVYFGMDRAWVAAMEETNW